MAHNPPSGCPSADLIKADGVDSATDVDAARGDAVDVLGHQAALSKDDSHGQSSRQGRGHGDCHQVEGTNNDVANCVTEINLSTGAVQLIIAILLLLQACPGRVTRGNSGLCCGTCVMSFEC